MFLLLQYVFPLFFQAIFEHNLALLLIQDQTGPPKEEYSQFHFLLLSGLFLLLIPDDLPRED